MKRSDYMVQVRATEGALAELERLYEVTERSPILDQAWLSMEHSIARLHQTIDGLVETQEVLRRQGFELTNARIRAEMERERYRSLFEGSPDGYLVTDAGGIIREANPAAAIMLGVQERFLLHKPLVTFLAASRRADFRMIISSIRRSDPLDIHEWDIVPRSGMPLQAAITISPERDPSGRVISIRWLLRDVSVQAMARDRLRRLSRQNELLLSSVGEGIFGVDRSGTATFLNPAGSRMLRRTAEEFVGGCIDELLHPTHFDDDARFVASSVTASLLDGKVRTSEVEFFERSDGTRFPVEYISTPIVEQGFIVGMVVAFRDITLRRETEERIRIMNLDLEKRVTERTAELEVANRQKDLLLESERLARSEAELANRVKDEFMAIVSHELRTPLTTIKTFTDLMLRNSVTEEDRREYLGLISNECDRQISLVQNVLDISYLESRGISISIESLDLAGLVRSCMIPHVRGASTSGLELGVELPPDLGPVRGDQFAVRRIISNLLENAVKYTPAGGRITVSVTETSGSIRLHVRDTGRGIRPEEMARIFDKFYRVGEDTTRSDMDTERGVGLGLYLARLLAGQIGARIEVESSPGEGSTFTLELERWETTSADQHHETES